MNLQEKTKEYLAAVFGENTEIRPYSLNGPMFLKRFPLFVAELLGHKIAFAVVTRDSLTPKEYARFAIQLRERIAMPPVFVFASMNGSRRNAFLREKVGFVVPGNQFFLPPFMDIKEWSPRTYERREFLSFASQAIILRELVMGDVEGRPLSGLAHIFGYSCTTMTNAAAELSENGIVEIVGMRPKTLGFLKRGRELWDGVSNRLRSPVKRVVLNKTMPAGLVTSGLSALSERTMIAEPMLKVFAATNADISNPKVFSVAESKDDAKSELQIWYYPPTSICGNGVDKYSLFLSLRKTSDPRIEGELEDLLEGRS